MTSKRRFELNGDKIVDNKNGLFSGATTSGGMFTFKNGETINLVDCMNMIAEVKSEARVEDQKVGVFLVGLHRDIRYSDLKYIEGLASIATRSDLFTSVYLEESFSYDESDIRSVLPAGLSEYVYEVTFGPVLIKFTQWYSKQICVSQWKEVDVCVNDDEETLGSIKLTQEQKDLFASLSDRKQRRVIEALNRL